MRSAFFIILLALFHNIYATIPPEKNVKPPAHFQQFKNQLEKEYSSGFYAEKFAARKNLRAQLSKSNTVSSGLPADTVYALTLLGRYSDASPIYTPESFQNHLFDGPNPTGTVTDYFNETSYGQLLFTGSCKGWYDMPGTLASYVGDNNGLGTQGGPKFVLDLVKVSDPDVNYSDYIQYYDAQGNPRIGFLAIVHTGSDAASGGNNIWSHRWNFRMISGGAYETNDVDPVSGKKVLIDGDYAIQPELEGSNNNSGPIKSIGVFAHEFGHIFGLPDLYDTDNSSEGLGNWCLMAGGSYGGNGNSAQTPVHFSAWCKEELGWVTPIEVVGLINNISIPNVEENPVIYKLWKKNNPASNEYYLVENRQKIKYDQNLYEPGLLIFHIDNNKNGNSDEDHPKVDLEQADGKRNLNNGTNRGDQGDPFPGQSNNRRFDHTTTPNSGSYSNEDTFVSVRNIRKDSLNMIANFDIGTSPYIEIKDIYFTEAVPGNGRVEQGETGILNISLTNVECTFSQTTKFRFDINEPLIHINTPEISTSVSAQGSRNVTIPSAFLVAPLFESKMVNLKYTVESEGNVFSDSVKIVLGIPRLLIVSKAEDKSLVNFYDSSFNKLGLNSEEVHNLEPEYLSDRDIVIYLSGQTIDSLFSASEIDSLTSYLNNGGNLFFSGQNIAEFLKEHYPGFLNEQVGIDWVKSGGVFYRRVYGDLSDAFGAQFPQISIFGSNGARNERTPDIISSNGEFKISFFYKQNLTEGGGGWMVKPSGAKIFFLGFGFESINNLESSKSRDEFMQSILNWFDTPVSAIEEGVTPFVFNLLQNYPNPFNPSTKIAFTIPGNGIKKTQLKIYDILGTEVAVLLNEELSAGDYIKEFSASAPSLASGVYYYTLNVGDLSQTRKMVYLK